MSFLDVFIKIYFMVGLTNSCEMDKKPTWNIALWKFQSRDSIEFTDAVENSFEKTLKIFVKWSWKWSKKYIWPYLSKKCCWTTFTEKITHMYLFHEESEALDKTYCVKSIQIRSFSWPVFSHIRTESREISRISPDSVRLRENTDQKKLRIWTLFTQWVL